MNPSMTGQGFCPRRIAPLLAGLALALTSVGAQAALYVYQMPGGTRIVTDRPIKNKDYVLVRKSNAPVTMDELVAQQRTVEAWTADNRYDELIGEAARVYGLSPALIKAVMHAESAFDPYAVSHRGAQGLMQIMPETAQRFGVKDAFDPDQNIHAGARFLAHLMRLFRHSPDLVLAAYNAGIAKVVRYNGIPPYDETREYVRKVRLFEEYYGGKRKKLDVALLKSPPAFTRADHGGPEQNGDGENNLPMASLLPAGEGQDEGGISQTVGDRPHPGPLDSGSGLRSTSPVPGVVPEGEGVTAESGAAEGGPPHPAEAEPLLTQEAEPVVPAPQLVSDARRRVEPPEVRRPE